MLLPVSKMVFMTPGVPSDTVTFLSGLAWASLFLVASVLNSCMLLIAVDGSHPIYVFLESRLPASLAFCLLLV